MQRIATVLAVLAIAGCAFQTKPEQVAEVNPADALSPGCYTVDLFDPYTIEPPAPDVPREDSAFLGVWKNGAWDGHWCHDLYITEVDADGRVTLLDAYGPWYKYGIEATVFKRQGRVEDGVLRFRSQYGAQVAYRIEDGLLIGHRRGSLGEMDVTMSREEGVKQSVAMMPGKPKKKPDRRS